MPCFFQASQQTKTTSTVGNFGPIASTSAAGAPTSSGSSLAPTGDRYAALSDLDSIFKTPPPSVGQQGSVFSSSSNTSSSFGMSGLSSTPSTGPSTGSSAMPSGPNPFASAGNTALPAQSNPFQSSTGAMGQSNGFPGGNAGFGTAAQSSAQSLNFAGAGMTAIAANQFSKMGGSQPGMFGNPGGAGSMQSAGFNTGQGQVSAGAQLGGGQFGGPQLGTSQLGNSQFGASQFGGSQFGGSQFTGSQFPGNQFGVAQGGQMGGGQYSGGQFGGAAMQQPQQQAFGGGSAGMGNNQFGQLQQQQQQQQFGGGWQQKPQSNPFMVRTFTLAIRSFNFKSWQCFRSWDKVKFIHPRNVYENKISVKLCELVLQPVGAVVASMDSSIHNSTFSYHFIFTVTLRFTLYLHS